MCPACLATMTYWLAGATSAGGLGVLAMKKLRAGTGAMKNSPVYKPKEKSS